MNPTAFPHFAVSELRGDGYIGQFDASPWVKQDWIAYVYVGGGRFLWGRFRDVDAAAQTCSFWPDPYSEPWVLRAGESYPFLDWYWGTRAALVLNERLDWHRTRFEPYDSVSLDGRVFPGGWDHQHCEVCWEKIGDFGQPEGFFSPPNSWVCEACYNDFIVTRSLGFVNWVTNEGSDVKPD